MKYIRTKDRIYEIESDYLNNKGVHVGYNVVGQEEIVLIENNKIIQADTIEELCDEFVIEKKGYAPFVSQTIFYNGKEHKEDLKALAEYYSGYDNIYGAIWTPKGLIYVAKMDNKGEWELI